MNINSVTISGQHDLIFERSPEVNLLLQCSRTHSTELQRDRIQALVQQPLDWDYLIKLATYHSVLPLLDRQLQQVDAHAIPPAVTKQLRDNFNDNFQRNLRSIAELLKLSRLFEDRSIPMLSFKGPTLAQIAYGNLALRQFLDLDVLVAEADVIKASQLLLCQGYQPQFTLTDRQQTTYTKLRNEHSFWHEEKQICVDLHWSILPKHYSFTPDPALLWTKIDRVVFGSQSIMTFTPEHLLLFLCAHGAKHNWSKLYWICDIAELLRIHENLDWNKINHLAGKFGTPRMLSMGLYLAHKLIDAKLPEAILIQLELDSKLPILFDQIQYQLFQNQSMGESLGVDKPIHPNRGDIIYRQTMTSFRDRAWYWIDTILTPTPLEWLIVTLPSSLFPLYYLIRLIRLTSKYLWRIA